MRILLVIALFSFAGISVNAQSFSIKGRISDVENGSSISGATVTLSSLKGSSGVKNMVSGSQGDFYFTDLGRDTFNLSITYVGYSPLQQRIIIDSADIDLGTLGITNKGKELADVVVTGKVAPTQQKGDTVQYNASQYKVNPDANVEDLIKKMPGITVDKAGTVTAHGEQVKKVTVDGKDFFGDDATAALRNLPAEVIDKIQVFDRLSDQAQFTGFDDGNSTKALNIVTKSGMKNGQFGRVYAGIGTDERYAAGGNVSFFKNDRRISIVGLFNNVNQQNFSSEDLLGVTGNSSSGGGSRRGRGRNRSGSGENFLIGQQNGINKTNAFGINFSDVWDKKLEVSGSYFFNNSNAGNNQVSNTQYFLTDSTNQFNDENTISSSDNYNHRFNLRLNYKIDSSNTLMITPAISFQKNNSFSENDVLNYLTATDTISKSLNQNNRSTSGYNISNNILYRHAFAKKGRTVSLNVNTSFNDKNGDLYQQSNNQYYRADTSIDNIITKKIIGDTLQQFTDQESDGYTLSANIAYTEPIGKKGQLQFNYNPSYSKSKSDQQALHYNFIDDKYSEFDTSLSNKFDNIVTKNNAGMTYRIGDRDNMFAIGVSYQHTQLKSEQIFPEMISVNKSFNNILPSFIWRKKISARANVRIFYRASTSTPSINKLQNVYDNSDPLFISTGNPDLKQQTDNRIGARYTYTNTTKGKSFFANVYVQQANNYISNASLIATQDSVLTKSVTLYKGSQLTKPVNLDGYVSLRSFFTYAMPVKAIKSNINLNAGFTWASIPGIVNGIDSRSDAYNYNTGITVSSNISEYIDFNISYNANFNVAKNSLQPTINNNYVAQTAGLQLNLLSKKGWFIQNDISNQSYSGLSGGFNQSYWLWNAGIGKKFLKKQAGELKLSVFDLLKQNQSITRNVTETYIEDVRNQVLQQYFMLTFTYKLKNFGVAKPSGNKEGDEPGRGPRF